MQYRHSSKSSALAMCPRCTACRSGEHLLLLFHGPTVSAQSVKHPALSPIAAKLLATDCFVFQRLLTNCQQRPQAPNLPFHYLHSLCNAVWRQHSPRKPRRRAGCLSTSPERKCISNISNIFTIIRCRVC